MLDRVVLDSRNKFVYIDNDMKDLFDTSLYQAKIDSYEPILVNVSDFELPNIESNLKLNRYMIESIYNNYYAFVIVLSIIDTLIKDIDKKELNRRFRNIFRLYSLINGVNINDIDEFRGMINDSKEVYREGYLEYINTGECNFFDKLKIKFIIVDNFVYDLRKSIGLDKYFSLVFNIDKDISIYDEMAINNYISSRDNRYISINVICNDRDWRYYYNMNGIMIENNSDYVEFDLRKSRGISKTLCKENK